MSGLYLHIPFCKQRCIYCDFYFVTSRRYLQSFTAALKRELAYWSARLGPMPALETIYFGGGTPSLLPTETIADLLDTVHRHFDTAGVEEYTLELNPDDVDGTYLKDLRQTGINRLSIGVQSFFEDDLQWMHRAHSEKEARDIVDRARSAGFENFSVDLIFGLPHQDHATWDANLKRAIALDIPHLSTYSLTVEPRTPLFKQVAMGKQPDVADHTLAYLYQKTMDTLRAAGYAHYEVSSFARPGYRSRHNQLYWNHTNYLGVGPSAHSFWQSHNGPAQRWANVRNLKQYLAWQGGDAPPAQERETVSIQALADEYVLLRLRTRDGLNLQTLQETYSAHLAPAAIRPLVEEGMAVQPTPDMLQLSDRGMMLCDAVTARLLAGLTCDAPV